MKIKQKILGTVVVLTICSSLFLGYSINSDGDTVWLLMENVESLTRNEAVGSVIKCRCSKAALFPNKECLASNNGNTCAQGSPGQNIDCTRYNSNCGGN